MNHKQSPDKWHILYTAPRAEKQVDQRLQKQGIQTYLPLHLSPRRWSDRIKWVEMPLFPSYIFVCATEPVLRQMLSVQGVARIVFYDGKPAIIKESEIKAIQTFLEQAHEKELRYTVDEQVLIACGPLKDISGKIKRIGKKYLLLYLDQIGISVSVALDQVRKR
jgi:transcription antitermination factor NusG